MCIYALIWIDLALMFLAPIVWMAIARELDKIGALKEYYMRWILSLFSSSFSCVLLQS